ncbi:MAG: tRNA pseudouridine(55) synthase TruB [Clostridia bacterium]|nr:tRNA pseudouridine(55) synthase TruB [Clostridia bacterium]
MKDGVIIINKSEGMSSFAVVARIRRLFGVKKAGHTGTLDPMATGVLPVLIGRAVKASEYMLTSDKHYRATLLLGVETDTEDVTGNVISTSNIIPSENDVFAAIESMLGESDQIPPMYSAIKVGGKKLCDMAREGEIIEREPRRITVYGIDARKKSEREYELDVHCSKGTYIRTLCADIGKKLGCGGTMKALMRLEASGFTVSEAVSLDTLEPLSESERQRYLLPTETVFQNKKKCILPPFFGKLGRAGAEVYLRKIDFCGEVGERVALFDDKGFFALGEIREYPDGLAIKPIKQFDTPTE